MIATLKTNGEIVLPREAGAAAGARPGQEYHVLISTSGQIMLRRRHKHAKPLTEHLQGLSGLRIERRCDPAPSPPQL